MADVPAPYQKSRFSLFRSTYVVGALAIVLVAFATFEEGVAGFLIFTGLFAFVTGLYICATGRKSWAMIPGGRKIGLGVVVGSVVLLFIGAWVPSPLTEFEASESSNSEVSSTPASTSSVPSPSKTLKPVPDVVGKTFQDARSTLNKAGYSMRVSDKDGKLWTNIVPDASVTVISMKTAPGTITGEDSVEVALGTTEAEYVAAKKAAADEAKIASRYTYNCGGSSSTTYKSYKDVWTSANYKDSGTCYIAIDGKDSYSRVPLLPSEQKIVDFVASKGGDVSVPSAAVGNVMRLCAKLAPDYADQVVARPEWRKSEAEAALTVCPDAPHAAILQHELTAVKVGDGNKIVGQTMEPGTYRTKPGAKDCYWSRNTGGGDIIANNFVGFAPDGVTVTVYPGEGFESSRCAPWTKIG